MAPTEYYTRDLPSRRTSGVLAAFTRGDRTDHQGGGLDESRNGKDVEAR